MKTCGPTGLLLTFVVAAWPYVTHAQTQAASVTRQYATRLWQSKDGLPHNSVQAITQTSDGFLWIGCLSGLARFDGVDFSIIEPPEAPQLKHASITSLSEDSQHALWIGTWDHGVTRLHDGTVTVFGQTNGLPSNNIRSIYSATDGSVWIGTDSGLAFFQRGKIETVTQIKRHTDVAVIVGDKNGSIYFGTSKGVKVCRPASKHQIEDLSATDSSADLTSLLLNTRALCIDHNGNFWCGANRVLAQASNELAHVRIVQGLTHNMVNALCEDHGGNLWIGTFGGLNQIPTGSDGIFEVANEGESFELIQAIFEDKEGNIWVGLQDGLARLQPKSFSSFTRRQGLNHNNVTSVLNGPDDRLWIGTLGGGLNSMQNNELQDPICPDYLITAMMIDPDRSVWFGADNHLGIFHQTTAGIVHLTVQQGFTEKSVRVIRRDRTGILWIGTRDGLRSFDGKNLTRYNAEQGLSANSVRDIHEDRQNQLWIATDNGLNIFRSGRFISLGERNALAHASVNCIYEDNEGTLWFGTRRGISRYQNGRMSNALRIDGASKEDIFGIIEDNRGALWMTSATGIVSVSKRDLADAMDAGGGSVKSIFYDSSDGLPTSSCSDTAQPSCCKTSDGRLWFATTRGLAVVDPASTRELNPNPPHVVIEKMAAENGTTSGAHDRIEFNLIGHNDATLELSPGRADLEIHYSALSFTGPEKNRYKYKLEGVNPDWISVGTRRVAYYNNLSPGWYTFRVAACNNDGVWNDTSTNIRFKLLPHIWQTWWFRTCAVLAIVSLVAGLARYGTRKRMQRKLRELERQNALEKERTRIARDMHDELGARLTEIAVLSTVASKQKNKPDAVEDQCSRISSAATELTDALHTIVWSVNPSNDTLEKLIDYIRDYAEAFLDASSIRCDIATPRDLGTFNLSSEVRHHVFMVVKEALNNTVKHADANEVKISIFVNGGTLKITIADNGRGFSIDAATCCGNGLANIQLRMVEIGGKATFETAPNTGTILYLQLPLLRAT